AGGRRKGDCGEWPRRSGRVDDVGSAGCRSDRARAGHGVEPMPVVEDFTVAAPGIEIDGEGRVERCPVCGRNGVREDVGSRTKYLHAQAYELMSDGLLVTPEECCVGDAAEI